MHDFYEIVRPVILPQLIMASVTIVCLSLAITLVIVITTHDDRKIASVKYYVRMYVSNVYDFIFRTILMEPYSRQRNR